MAKQTVTVELFYDAAWNAAPVYTRDSIHLQHGRRAEADLADPADCALTVDNRDDAYNPRNPTSALYGKIGRNTPVRVKVGTAVRFLGEGSAWQPGRSVDGSDAWVELACGGIRRRLGQGAKPLRSALYRELTSRANDGLVAYWPCEDGAGANAVSSAIGGHPAMTVVGTAQFASFEGFDCSDPLPALDSAGLFGAVPKYVVTGETSLRMLVSIPAAGTTNGAQVAGLSMTGTAAEWRVLYGTGGTLTLRVRDKDGGTLHDTGAIAYDVNGALFSLGLEIVQDGADIDFDLLVFKILPGGGSSATSHSDTISSETAFRCAAVSAAGNLGLSGAAFGHISLADDAAFYADTAAALLAHYGETAGERIERLCDEQGVTFTSEGTLADTAPLGVQFSDTFLDVAQEAAATDLGALTDAVDSLALHYRTRTSLYNQAAALTLDFDGSEIAPPLHPAVDDQHVRNDVTVKGRGGGELQAVDDDGPLGVDAIGRYDTSVTVSAPGHGFLANQAGWRLHLGTVDDDRWPRVAVDLDAAPSLVATVDAIRVGDRIDLENLPAALAMGGTASLLVQGWTEDVGSHRRVVVFNCTPEPPWRVAKYEAAAGSSVHKYDTAGSELASAIDDDDTTLSVATTVGPLWTTTDAEDGFDVIIGGEVMTVTDVSGASSPQTFTVTRSVNGVVKAHAIGAPVKLYPTPRYAL